MSENNNNKSADFKRLSDKIVPKHYDLSLKPDMKVNGTYKFDGHVDIHLDIKINDNKIKFNCAEIVINKAVLKQNDNVLNGKVIYEEKNETATVEFESNFNEGNAILSLTYVGTLNDQLKGFYRSLYKTSDGRETLIACTQFEATDARRGLPCWDEPAIKSTFSVKLTVPSGLTAVSNMPVIAQNDVGDNLVEYTYDKSPIMSTYLLAFVVGEFESIETHDSNGVLIRVFAPIGKGEQGRFALDVAAKVLPYFSDYFEIKYPLPKLDLLAIPDFAAGAMENWGCVTYREPALLVDPKNPSQVRMQRVAIVVAHELAHQWFGNLVTMEWWTHLWLNEGFATWIEYLAVDKFFPEWNMWTQFVDMDLGRSLNLDALESSHPIEVEVNHPDEVTEIFDIISYSKGSCAIRMLVEYLGQEPFRKGLCSYLQKYKYGNAFTHDLWNSLSEATGKPVGEVMNNWIKKTGYPYIEVSVNNENNNELILKQNRFLSSGAKLSNDDEKLLWNIPIRATIAGKNNEALNDNNDKIQLMSTKISTINIDMNNIDWIKFNKDQTGHYRVLYSNDLLTRLLDAIRRQDQRLSQTERLAIQSDAFALTGAQLMPIQTLFEVILCYKNETSYPVWSDLSTNVRKLSSLLMMTDLYDDFTKFCSSLYESVGKYVGWESEKDEDPLKSLLRAVVLSSLTKYGNEQTTNEAAQRFQKYSQLRRDQKDEEANKILAADLRGNAYRCAINKFGQKGFEDVLEIYENTNAQEEKMRALNVLGTAKEEELVKRAFEFTMSDKVRSGDVFYGLTSCLSNRYHGRTMWEYAKSNWERILTRVGASFQTGRIISALSVFASEEIADDIETFFKTNKAPAAERSIQQTCEAIRSNARWLKRDRDGIVEFLKNFKANNN